MRLLKLVAGALSIAAITGLICACMLLALGMISDPAYAQSVGTSFGGFSAKSNEPIDIESDTLEVQDTEKIAIFSGDVKATQGKMTMRSKQLKVKYSGDQNAGGSDKKSSGNQITSIRADGKVLINTADDQSATSEWALFDVVSQTVTLGGNVVLSQSGNVIKGDQLIIDLKTNRSRIVNQGDPSKRQRVRGLFMPQAPDAETAPKKPDAQ